MAVSNVIKVVKVFTSTGITKNTSIEYMVDVTAMIGDTVGRMAYQYYVASAGAANVDITYTLSLDNVTYFTPGTTMIKEEILPASSSTSGGAEYDFQLAPFMKFKAAETGNAADVTQLDLWVAFG